MIGGPVARHTLGIRRPAGTENGHGNTVRTYPGSASHQSPGWALDAGTTSESRDGRLGIIYAYTARGPFDADVIDGDRVDVFGSTYDIDGGVVRQPGPSAMTSHTILQLRFVAG